VALGIDVASQDSSTGVEAITFPASEASDMCRNIRPLFNFDPPATDEEIRAAASQYVRKITGSRSRLRRMRMRSSARSMTSRGRRQVCWTR